jgi:2-hydroxy-3-keto-5-methylthiopentenyl-1-phosphate phosphatase
MIPDLKNKPLAVLVDFDGTITTRDMGDLVVEEFAEPGWESLIDLYRAGEINVREIWAREMKLLREDREAEAVERCLDVAEIREGFGNLVNYCKSNGISIEVASSGLDFYVDAILAANGFGDLPKARPVTRYDADGRGFMAMDDGVEDCGMTAMCKCARIWRLRRKGYRVMFIGDGISDACAVTQADIVLATGRLRATCTEKGIEHTPFESFHDVLAVVRR